MLQVVVVEEEEVKEEEEGRGVDGGWVDSSWSRVTR